MPEELAQSCRVEPDVASLLEVVAGVAAEVLETMFFAEAVPAACCHDWLGSALAARICFAGSHFGEMRLSASLEAADSIAGAFLGIEPLELTEPLRNQVMLELANILCGAILSRLWPESKLALGAPELRPAGEDPDCRLHECLELPEGKLAICILWRESAGTC
jgi:CheY-specific phosphatase CheX